MQIIRSKLILGIILCLILVGMLTSALTVQPIGVRAFVPAGHAWIHGHICKSGTQDLPLRGILLELWDNSSNMLVVNTTSSDSDLDPGAFDFGNIYTGPSRTFFARIVAKGYNSTGYNMLDVVNETTGTLIFYDSQSFTCYSEQDYYPTLYGPDEGDPTTAADLALSIYHYVWLVYDYFRVQLDHYISHVTANLIPGFAGAYAGASYLGFGESMNEFHRHAFGHEYGHSIMFQIYNPRAYCNSTQGHASNHADRSAWNMSHNVLADPDFGNAENPVPCSDDALVEGWANFIPWLVYGDYNYTYGPEWFGWWLDQREGAGEKNEYGFSGILYDICNIPGQNRNTMMRYIWEVITKDQPGAVNMFYDAFVTHYPELADHVKIAYMRRFAMFSRLGIEVQANENASGLHVTVSGYLMPFPHPNKTVTVDYRPVGVASWSWLANVTTDSNSFYSVTADLPEGVYEFQASWAGDRDHHTGHYGSTSEPVRTDEHYVGAVDGVKFYTDKSAYYLGDTGQIKIVNTNYTRKNVSSCPLFGRCCQFPIFYNFSYIDCNLQVYHPNGTLALNQSIMVSPFYGSTMVNFTTMIVGSYSLRVFTDVTGPEYVGSVMALLEEDVLETIVNLVNETRFRWFDSILAETIGPRPYNSASNIQAAEFIMNQLNSTGTILTSYQWFSHANETIPNVIGTLPSADPITDQKIVVCAHFDTVPESPGADDDGSGTALLLEVAKVLSVFNFPITIEFVAFNAEEEGLRGSRYYVQQSSQTGEDILLAMNVDMCIWDNPAAPSNEKLWIIYNGTMPYEKGEHFADITLNVSNTYTAGLIQKRVAVMGLGDHVSFWNAGIPSALIFEYRGFENPYYHSPGDYVDAEGYNFTLGANAAQVVAATVANLALTFDATHPNITDVFQTPPLNSVLPEDEVKINATVTDVSSGVKQVILNYTNGNGTWITVIMTNLEGNVWNGTIPSFDYCTQVNYIIIAEDHMGNIITTEEMGNEYQYHVIQEFPSTIVLLILLVVLSLLMIGTLRVVMIYREIT